MDNDYKITAELNKGAVKLEEGSSRFRPSISEDEIDKIRINTKKFMPRQENRVFFVDSVSDKKLFAESLREEIERIYCSERYEKFSVKKDSANALQLRIRVFYLWLINAEMLPFWSKTHLNI